MKYVAACAIAAATLVMTASPARALIVLNCSGTAVFIKMFDTDDKYKFTPLHRNGLRPNRYIRFGSMRGAKSLLVKIDAGRGKVLTLERVRTDASLMLHRNAEKGFFVVFGRTHTKPCP